MFLSTILSISLFLSLPNEEGRASSSPSEMTGVRSVMASLSLPNSEGRDVASSPDDWQYYLYSLIYGETGEAGEGWGEAGEIDDALVETISEIAQNPVNINTITREELEQMVFFSEQQIDAILDFVHRYGPLYTKGVLTMIHNLDHLRIGLLSSLTYIGEMPPREKTILDTLVLQHNKREMRRLRWKSEDHYDITSSVQIPLYKRRGDGAHSDGITDTEGAYHGSNIKHWWRASAKLSENIKIGIVAAQDAGEPFFNAFNRYGYDFYSGYIRFQARGRRHTSIVRVKDAIIGRYRVKGGVGLSMNSSLSFGKTFSLASLTSSSCFSLMPHISRSDATYLQGAAATVAIGGNMSATAFISYRECDATLTDDGNAIHTLLKSGYHRTTSELVRKNNVTRFTIGGHTEWRWEKWQVGVNAVFNRFSLPLAPVEFPVRNSQIYRVFYPTGNDFWNVSADYQWHLTRNVRLKGETGTGDCGQWATVNIMSWQLSRRLTILAIQRLYPYRFYAVMGNSFSEGGSNQNESGLYAGVNWIPNSRLSVTAYSDFAYFAWPRYQAFGASHSMDNFVQCDYMASSNISIAMRYRWKMREKDNEEKTALIYRNEQRVRLSAQITDGRWTWHPQLDFSYSKHTEVSVGGMAGLTAKYAMKPLEMASGINYFRTNGYDSRVYAYEQSTPYNLSFPSFYGHGFRAYALAQVNGIIISNRLRAMTLIGKVGYTHYFDRDEIGSGYQTIYSSSQTDVNIMVRVKW